MKLSLLSSCVALVAMTLAVEAAPSGKKINVALKKNSDYKPSAKRAVAKAKAKYYKYAAKSSKKVHARSGTIPVTDYANDIEYYGTIEVGTPAQKLKLDFDTGSSDLWFASTLCSTCTTHTRYNPSKSSTYVADGRTWSIEYEDRSTASGILAYDTVSLGGLAIKNQTIELAKKESSSFASGVTDGLLGLAFDTLTTVSGVKTPMDNLISQGLISSPVFGVYLGKEIDNGGGEYIFGGYDSSKYTGSLTTVSVDNSQGFWGVTSDKVSVGSTSVGSSMSGILDTGTTLLLLPDDIAAKVADAYGATDNGDGTYTISCSTSDFKPLYFTMGGTTFTVPVDSIIFEEDEGTCFASFGYGGLDFAILGDVFLKNNYVVFNPSVPEVKIAPSINN